MAAKLAGCEVARVEVGKDGRIVVILANANGSHPTRPAAVRGTSGMRS